MATRPIQLGDEVKNLNSNDVSGTVITVINRFNGITTIDVRCGDRIHYDSPIGNWETIVKVEDRE